MEAKNWQHRIMLSAALKKDFFVLSSNFEKQSASFYS